MYIKSGPEENVFHRSKCLITTNIFEGKIFYDNGNGTKGNKAGQTVMMMRLMVMMIITLLKAMMTMLRQ